MDKKDKVFYIITSLIYVFIADTVVDIMAVSDDFINNLIFTAFIMFSLYLPTIMIYNRLHHR